jgi:hypothetical protein
MSEHSKAPFELFRFCIWDADDFVIAVMVEPPGQHEKFEVNGRLFEKSPEILAAVKLLLQDLEAVPTHLETRRTLENLIAYIEGPAAKAANV